MDIDNTMTTIRIRLTTLRLTSLTRLIG